VPTLVAIVVANMIGAGVFTTSGFALADLGSVSWVMTAWVVGGVLALLGAVCYGALASYLRESGGEYLFLARTVHPQAGFLAGWVSLFAGFTGAIAVAASAAEAYVADSLPDWLPANSLGTVLILLAGLLHAVRLAPGAWIQNIAVGVKMAVLFAMVMVGVSALSGSADPLQGESATEVIPAGAPSWGAFATSLMWISLSYSGWNAAVYVAGEARDPIKQLPRALLIGTGAVIALYLCWNFVVLAAAPAEQLSGRPDVAAVAAHALGGEVWADAVSLVIVLALWTSVSSMVMVGPRVYAQMAEDGALPRWLAFRGDTPRAAILMQVVLSVLLLHAYDLRTQLTNLGWILSVSTAAAVYGLLRERRRVGPERLPILGGASVAWIFLFATLALTAVALQANPGELGYAVGVLGSGALIAFIRQRRDQAAS
jgi:APA family basic amino acid/polyamine antiporter